MLSTGAVDHPLFVHTEKYFRAHKLEDMEGEVFPPTLSSIRALAAFSSYSLTRCHWRIQNFPR
jgi:predicted nuclease with RNAse H fold